MTSAPRFADPAVRTAFEMAVRALTSLEEALVYLETVAGFGRPWHTPDAVRLEKWAKAVRGRGHVWYEERLAKLLLDRRRTARREVRR